MRGFTGSLLVTLGVGAIVVTVIMGLFAGTDTSAVGGFGVLSSVFGAAILNGK